MKKFLLYTTLLTLYPLLLIAQVPDTVWTQTYGGAQEDAAYSVQQTNDGGYIIAGHTWSYGAGDSDVWLVKTNASGDTLWTRTFGGSGLDEAHAVQQTNDGGYIIVGSTFSFASGCQVYLIKTDANGDTAWTKTYGGEFDDDGWSVQQTSDQGYIITGKKATTYYDYVYVIKTNVSGDTLWTKTYGEMPECCGRAIQQTPDGGFIIAGYIADPCGDYYNIYLIKTGSLGDTIWSKNFGYWNTDQVAYSIRQTADYGYIIAGYTETQGSSNDVYLVKTNGVGDTVWTRTYGGELDDEGWSVQQTADQGYIITGSSCPTPITLKDVYVIRTDINGDTLWTKTYGGPDDDWGSAIQCTQDSGYIIVGTTKSFGAGDNDIWLLKIGPEIGIEEEKELNIKSTYSTTILSGPLLLPAGKKCRVFDITGRVVSPTRIKPGIYFVKIDNRIVRKVVKIKD